MKSNFINIILTVAVCFGLLLVPASTLAAGECGIAMQPSEQRVGFNQEFAVDVVISNPEALDLDAAACHINFSTNLVEVINITNVGSPFSLKWAEEFSNTAGYVDYDYSTPAGTNINETAPYLCTVNMKSKAASGTATLEFVPVDAYGDPETQVLYVGTDYLGWSMVANGTVTVGTPTPEISFSPSSLSFSAVEGGSNPAGQTFGIWNSGGETLNWSLSDDADWLSESPTSGNSTGERDYVTVAVNITGMPADDYSADITITAVGASNSPQIIPVGLHITLPSDGGEVSYYITVDMLGDTSQWKISQSGNLEQPVKLSSEDGKVTISLGKDASCLDKDGNRLAVMSISEEPDLPALPENHHIIGKAYKLEPSGAKFNPYLSLALSYEDDNIPQYVFEEDICIAYYNVTNESWTALSSQVDTQNNTVTSPVSHFTTFAIMGNATSAAPVPTPAPAPTPAEFTLTSLNITPGQVEPGQPLTISIQVANVGGSEGNYTVVLKIDNIEEAREEGTLGVGKFETVNFTTARDAVGSYIVTIDGQSGQFIVTAPSWLSQYWWIIAAVCIGIGTLICLLIIRRRRAF